MTSPSLSTSGSTESTSARTASSATGSFGDRRTPLVLGDPQRRCACARSRCAARDVALLGHQREHEIAALQRARCGLSRGVYVDGALGSAASIAPSAQRELVDALAEQVAARRLDAVHAVAEVDDVEVVLEDLVLGELALEQAREPQLDRASGAASGRGSDRPRKLLRATCMVIVLNPSRTPPALRLRATARKNAAPVEAVVLVEAPVLGGDERLRARASGPWRAAR